MGKLDIEPSIWPELSRLLDQALDQPVDSREAWLESLSAPADRLKPQLRELLSRAAAVETGDFLHTIPSVAGMEESAPPNGRAGDVVGPYRLIREIGSGGMGSVWLAERVDGLINRPVALKLPHLVASRSAGLAERMARERAILAALDHRNVAKLLDAGVTPGGQPFLALEYVEGMPLDQHAAGGPGHASPDLQAKLRLFRQVVDAVAFAHAKLVLHRDIKPANILVTPGGGVKLLDFGVAKLLSDGQATETQLTRISGRAFTPDYASPEQILGQPLTVASDVYSLGVVLFELLAGTRPYKLKRDSRGALEDAILHGETPKLSATAAPPLRKALRGDLDTIVAKSLKRNPTERYPTANALLEDITRYLEHRPVLAQPDSSLYRLRKFVLRNRVAVAAGSVVVAAIVAGAAVAVWQARVAVAERDRALEVERFVTTIFRDANPYGDAGRRMTAVELLHGARQQVDLEFESRPELRLSLLAVIGSSLMSLGDLDVARDILAGAREEALRLHGERDPETLRLHALLADVYSVRGDVDWLRRELPELETRLASTREVDAETRVRLLKIRASLAFHQGEYERAGPLTRRALDIAIRELGPRHALTVTMSTLLAETHLVGFRDIDLMLADTERGLRFVEAAYPGQPLHSQVTRMREVRGRALGTAGRFHEAIAEQSAAMQATRQLLGEDSLEAAYTAVTLSAWQRRVGEIDAALANSAHALATLRSKAETRTNNYVQALTSHGVNLLVARRPSEAHEFLRDAEQLATELFGEIHWDTVTARLNRATALAYLGQHAAAERAFEVLSRPGVEVPLPWWVKHVRGITHRLRGEAVQAAQEQASALSLIAESPRAPWDRVRVLSELGLAQAAAGQRDDALSTLARAESSYAELRIAEHAMTREVRAARHRLASGSQASL